MAAEASSDCAIDFSFGRLTMVYNELGEVVSRKARKVAAEIGRLTETLYVDLFRRGMTPVEGIALEHYLEGQVMTAATLELLKHRCKRPRKSRKSA